jgi:hypothetical protein
MSAPPGKRTGQAIPRYEATRHRDRLSTEYLRELNLWMKHYGRKAIEKVGRQQPAALLKIIALTLPKEHKVEHPRKVSELSDDQLNDMIEVLSARLEARAQGIEVPPLIDITPDGRFGRSRRRMMRNQRKTRIGARNRAKTHCANINRSWISRAIRGGTGGSRNGNCTV